MLKHNIAILIAGGLLSAQVNLAAADQGTFTSNDTEVIWKPLPAQLKYFDERKASIQRTATYGRDAIPPSADDLYSKMLPAQARYFEQRTALVLATPAIAQRQEAQRTVELKDGSNLYIYKDGKMAMEGQSGRPMSMKDGMRMETKKSEVIIMRGNELWRLFDPTRPTD